MTIPLLLEHNSSTQIVFDDFKGLNDWTNNIKSPVIKILPYCTLYSKYIHITYTGLIKFKTILSNKISFFGLRFKTEYRIQDPDLSKWKAGSGSMQKWHRSWTLMKVTVGCEKNVLDMESFRAKTWQWLSNKNMRFLWNQQNLISSPK